MSVNITEVRLLNVPLESDYKHTFWFANKNAQTEYFKTKTYKTYKDMSYQRKEAKIRVPAQFDTLIANCNYVMYTNPAYSNKWFYAFITDFEHRNDGTTWVHIATDVMQTWMFDINIRPSFVEREHVNDDTAGLHTVPEQLETGDYVCNGSEEYTGFDEYGVIVASSVALGTKLINDGECPPVIGGRYNNVFSGLKYYYFSFTASDEYIAGVDALNFVIESLAEKGQSDAIVSLFVAPKMVVTLGEDILLSPDGAKPVLIQPVAGSTTATIKNWSFNKPSQLVNYTPKNKKLLTFPYSYLMMSNHNGANAVYKYELFNNATLCTLRLHGAVTPGCSIRLFPTNYANEAVNYEEGLTCGKFPICNWTTDVYTNWLTQNSLNIAIQGATAGLQIAGGVATVIASGGAGAAIGASGVVSGITGIANLVSEKYQHSLIPPQAEGNINSGDACFAGGNLTFKGYHMSIRPEFAKIIDGYFTMFGYKVNTLKTPNTNHRNNFWFTKTVDINIDGALPNTDMSLIKQCYNNGITFWRYPANIGNYSVDNSIL